MLSSNPFSHKFIGMLHQDPSSTSISFSIVSILGQLAKWKQIPVVSVDFFTCDFKLSGANFVVSQDIPFPGIVPKLMTCFRSRGCGHGLRGRQWLVVLALFGRSKPRWLETVNWECFEVCLSHSQGISGSERERDGKKPTDPSGTTKFTRNFSDRTSPRRYC